MLGQYVNRENEEIYWRLLLAIGLIRIGCTPRVIISIKRFASLGLFYLGFEN